MIEATPALVIGEKERGTIPALRVYQRIDNTGHLLLPQVNIGRRMFAKDTIRDDERDLRKRIVIHIVVIVQLAVVEATVELPFFEEEQRIEKFDFGNTAQATPQVIA